MAVLIYILGSLKEGGCVVRRFNECIEQARIKQHSCVEEQKG